MFPFCVILLVANFACPYINRMYSIPIQMVRRVLLLQVSYIRTIECRKGKKLTTGLRYTEVMPGQVGRPVERSLRKRIRELLKSGVSQVEIARILDKVPSTIAHHVRALGQKAKQYESPAPVGKDGKRRCVQCGKRKSLGAFPNERNASCSMCVRGLSD